MSQGYHHEIRRSSSSNAMTVVCVYFMYVPVRKAASLTLGHMKIPRKRGNSVAEIFLSKMLLGVANAILYAKHVSRQIKGFMCTQTETYFGKKVIYFRNSCSGVSLRKLLRGKVSWVTGILLQ